MLQLQLELLFLAYQQSGFDQTPEVSSVRDGHGYKIAAASRLAGD